MTAPNTTLRAVRTTMLMSQDDLAQAIRDAGDRAGQHLDVSKRTIQRWESGTSTPRPVYARVLQMVTGLPIESLGFPADADRVLVDDGRGGHDLEVRQAPVTQVAPRPGGNHAGIWRSRYEYFSSGRAEAYEGLHAALLLQYGDRLTVRSIPGSASSSMSMDLTVDGPVVTGTWVEQTAPTGYYRGARYHGAIQMAVDPTGRRMSGKWVGFGKDGDVNTGPWVLTFEEASTSSSAVARYSRPLSQD